MRGALIVNEPAPLGTQAIGDANIVIIEVGDEIATRIVNDRVARRCHARIALMYNKSGTRLSGYEFFDDPDGPVGRAIVYNDHFETGPILAQGTMHRAGDGISRVVAGYAYGN